jgi:competence protein ComEA
MWTNKHWKILFTLLICLCILLTYREIQQPMKANLQLVEATQIEEIEESINEEIKKIESYYRDGRLLINQAPKEKIVELPGIGPVLADRIISYRSNNGGFKRVEELRNVKGIGVKKLEALRGRVICE